MNSLSWFLYLSEILSGIDEGLSALIWISIVIVVATTIGSFIIVSDYDKNHQNQYLLFLKKVLPRFGIVVFIVFIIVQLIPSKNTMYAIAASQIGETILQLEQTQQIGGELGELAKDSLSLLRQKINDQLGEQEK